MCDRHSSETACQRCPLPAAHEEQVPAQDRHPEQHAGSLPPTESNLSREHSNDSLMYNDNDIFDCTLSPPKQAESAAKCN
jgi:hypothetical protein